MTEYMNFKIQIFFFLGVFTLLTSCVPKPGGDQVTFDAGSVGRLEIVQSTQLGVFSVGEVHPVILTLKNTGKLKANFSDFKLTTKEKIQFVGDTYPGLGGNCQDVLKSGESCTLALQAFSSTIEEFSEPFLLEYTNGVGKASLSGSFTGYFGTPARIELSLSVDGQGMYDFGLVEPGVTKNYLLEIENKGNLRATSFIGFFDSTDPIFHFNGGFYPGLNGSCSTTLLPGEKCILDIAVTPQEAGKETTGSLKVNYSNPLSSRTFTLNLKVFSAEIKAYLSVHEKYQMIPDTVNKAQDSDLPRVIWTVENVGLAPATDIALTSGDIPFTFISSDCPSVLHPSEICSLTYKLDPQYDLPLPSGMSFPISFNERGVQFSFMDSKNPLPALSEEVKVNAKILDEAQLVFYRDGNQSLPFPYLSDSISGSGAWTREHWFGVIGDSVFPTRNLSIVNPGMGIRSKATNIVFEIVPNDGQLTLGCMPNCSATLNPGSTINTTVQYKPEYQTPYEPLKDYVIRVTYFSGRRSKTYDLTIETESKATPLISIIDGETNLTNGASLNVGSTLPGKSVQKTIQIYNYGPFDFSPDVSLVANGGNYFSLPGGSCHGAIIKNGQSCDLIIEFQKNEYDPIDSIFSQEITFDNGLDPSSPDYIAYSFHPYANLVPYGEISLSETSVDFGTVPWSRAGYPQIKISGALVGLAHVQTTWAVSKIKFEVLGPDASSFSYSLQGIPVAIPEGESLNAGEIALTVTPPYGDSTTPLTLNATLRISYYGRWASDFVDYLPGDYIDIPIQATISNSAYLILTGATQDYGPLAEGLQESGTIKVRNIGQETASVTSQFFQSMSEHGNVKGDDFKLVGMVGDTNCQQTSLNNDILIFNIAADSECTLNVLFSPTGPGDRKETFYLNYTTSFGKNFARSEVINGAGLNLASIGITPGNTNGNKLHEYGELRLGQSLAKTFTLTQQMADATLAEVVSIDLLPYGANCAVPDKIPTAWEGRGFISGNNIDFTVTSNTCSVGLNLNFQESCSVSINFSPQSMDKVIGTCLAITYKPYPSAPPAAYRKTIQQLGGFGLAPNGIFNGWAGVFAEGETEADPYKVKLQWKPMSVEDNLGTIAGYNIYRKKIGDATYPSEPLNNAMISTPVSGGDFEFTDSQTEDIGPYTVPVEGEVYQYVVKPFLSIPGVGTYILTNTTQVDRFIRVIIPFQNTTLIHRVTANIWGCTQMLNKTFAELDRTKSYSCNYNGFGNSGNIYDVAKDRIIDRYENTILGGEPSNSPTSLPNLYSSLATAKDSCTAQKGTVSDLAIYDKNKRLISRQDYMMASMGQSKSGCIDSSTTLEMGGRNQCKSIFGVEDLIGNAWEYIDAELTAQSSPSSKWKISSSMGIGDNRDWLFNIPLINFEEVDLTNPLTYTERKTYSGSETKCIHPLFGLPMMDVAGICANGSQTFAVMEPKLNISPDFFYIFTFNNSQNVFESYEGKRYMMAGGSYKTRASFGIDINRYTTYWSNPEIESILYTSNPSSPWEGGAARCVLDINY